jgi:aspartate aminotransferase
VPQARIIGNTIHVIHTSAEEQWRLSAADLDDFMQSRREETDRPFLLILNYPGNPDGITYSEAEVKALAEVAAAHHIYVLSDEIYGQLHHKGQHVSIARFYPEGTIISSGLSKWCGAGGWRLGTFSFPHQLRWLMEAMAAVASETYTSVSAPIQYAAIQAFLCGAEIENYLSHVRRILAMVGQHTASVLRRGNIIVNDPTGGFYLFLDFTGSWENLSARGIMNGTDLCEALLNDCGVAILPGSDFNRPEDELTARLSYVDFNGAEALTASYAIPLNEPLPQEFIEQYCSQVIRAAETIVEWLNA